MAFAVLALIGCAVAARLDTAQAAVISVGIIGGSTALALPQPGPGHRRPRPPSTARPVGTSISERSAPAVGE